MCISNSAAKALGRVQHLPRILKTHTRNIEGMEGTSCRLHTKNRIKDYS